MRGNIKSVSMLDINRVRVELAQKMDIYEPSIQIIHSNRNEILRTNVVSDIVNETDIVEFELVSTNSYQIQKDDVVRLSLKIQ